MTIRFSHESAPEEGRQEAALSLRLLRRFVQEAGTGTERRRPLERCELCSAVLPATHRHLLAPFRRQLLCVCDPCALLFKTPDREAQYRLIPERYLRLVDFQMSEALWEALQIPVSIVYLFYSTPAGRVVAFYPGPAGATESLLALDQWAELRKCHPLLDGLAADVEALLINRLREAREYYLVPIDACYRLVGLLRATWRGLSGGEEAQRAMVGFFEELRARAEPVSAGQVGQRGESGQRAGGDGNAGSEL
jgi:hypothetical protein